MSMLTQETIWRPFVALDPNSGTSGLSWEPTAGCRRSIAAAVEHAVIEAPVVELEIGTDGTLLAATPGAKEPLAAVSPSCLVASALDASLADPADAAAELRELEGDSSGLWPPCGQQDPRARQWPLTRHCLPILARLGGVMRPLGKIARFADREHPGWQPHSAVCPCRYRG